MPMIRLRKSRAGGAFAGAFLGFVACRWRESRSAPAGN